MIVNPHPNIIPFYGVTKLKGKNYLSLKSFGDRVS